MSGQPSALVDIRERQYISQWAQDVLGLTIMRNDALTDVDDDEMTVTLMSEERQDVVFRRSAVHAGPGMYETQLNAEDTELPGFYTVIWTYSLAGVAEEYRTYAEIGEAAPDYDVLPWELKAVIDLTWIRFADLFDSALGGPHLQSYFQTHWGRNRMAQLLRIAVGTLNTVAQPYQTYTINGVGGALFPVARWGPLLERSLYIESIKHLRRTYVEQPMFIGGSVTRLDRRDYLDRWGMILAEEQSDFQRQLETFKIANMGLGRPAVLVSGGVYGRFGPTRIAGSIAARPRYWTRWY